VNEALSFMLIFTIMPVGIASCVAAIVWVIARQREREALYRSEAIKKVAEMQGATPEPVLQLLREALAPAQPSMPSYPAVAKEYRREREAFYRAEMFKKLGELQGSDAVLGYLREEEEIASRRRHHGMMLGGLITLVVGLGLMVGVRSTVPGGVYLVAVTPILIGLVLIVYARASRPPN